MIYYSTGGYRKGSALDIAQFFLENGVSNIELSGGAHNPEQIRYLEKMKKDCSFIVHNYFPPPEKSFVFNLSSLNNTVSDRSIEHFKNACITAKKLGSKYYSFHAGFLLDPQVHELGKTLELQQLFPRQEAKKIFLDRIRMLADFADGLSLRLLIENNVCSLSNFTNYGQNVLLMVEPTETVEIMEALNGRVGLLVDLAHLKVSARTLDFDPVDFLKRCDRWIEGYHFSDNDGREDTNQNFDDDVWFKNYLKCGLDYYTIEVYDYDLSHVKKQLSIVKKLVSEN